MRPPDAPQDLVERALQASRADGCIAIAHSSGTTNLRWANNTLTTNGVTDVVDLTVIATVAGRDGVRAAALTRTGIDGDGAANLAAAAEAAARASVPADDAAELFPALESPDWADPPERPAPTSLAPVAGWLGETFKAARAAGEGRYGYAEHSIDTTYLGTSTGIRRRHSQPAVRLELTGRSSDGTRSAWSGQAAADVAALDLPAVEADVAKRLSWSARRVALDAGHYDTILPPSAVADLMIYAYWSAGALDAHEGRSVYSRPGGGTRVGERLCDLPLSLRSDPDLAGQRATPFVTCSASSRMSSVFDNGGSIPATDWIRDGSLAALIQTRHSAATTGLPFTPWSDNLQLDAAEANDAIDDLVAATERGLLLTCLWYIREVDPQTLLLTGLTRDGVFLVEGGEVVGAVNNFRFNESPIGMLHRVAAAGRSEPTLAREFGDYFTRTTMPTLRIADFNMSSVSQAS